MGKLSVRGNAAKEYKYDLMIVKVYFQTHAVTSSKAMREVLSQCESFLSYLEEQGINLNNIQLGENGVEQQYDNDVMDVEATREVRIRLPFDMTFINALMEMLEKQPYDIDFDTEYLLSNEDEIRSTLIKEAVQDSKSKAEMIADTVGQHITGIESVSIGDFTGGNPTIDWMVQESPRMASDLTHSNKLSAKTVTLSESVDVTWLIE